MRFWDPSHSGVGAELRKRNASEAFRVTERVGPPFRAIPAVATATIPDMPRKVALPRAGRRWSRCRDPLGVRVLAQLSLYGAMVMEATRASMCLSGEGNGRSCDTAVTRPGSGVSGVGAATGGSYRRPP